jgi:hypothetical protein
MGDEEVDGWKGGEERERRRMNVWDCEICK